MDPLTHLFVQSVFADRRPRSRRRRIGWKLRFRASAPARRPSVVR